MLEFLSSVDWWYYFRAAIVIISAACGSFLVWYFILAPKVTEFGERALFRGIEKAVKNPDSRERKAFEQSLSIVFSHAASTINKAANSKNSKDRIVFHNMSSMFMDFVDSTIYDMLTQKKKFRNTKTGKVYYKTVPELSPGMRELLRQGEIHAIKSFGSWIGNFEKQLKANPDMDFDKASIIQKIAPTLINKVPGLAKKDGTLTNAGELAQLGIELYPLIDMYLNQSNNGGKGPSNQSSSNVNYSYQ